MDHVSIDDVEPDGFDEASSRRGLSGPLGTTNVAINHYRLPPGEGLPGGLHAHADQEEVFVVLEGKATFETMSGEVTVGEGEVIRFDSGEFQSGGNASDRELVVLALGAPRDTQDTRIPASCPTCGHGDLRLDFDDGELTFSCPDCESEYVPEDCPECGDADLEFTLDEDSRPIVVCQVCDATFENPPLRN